MDFYHKVRIVDQLRHIGTISVEEQNQLVDLIAEGPVREYFFKGLRNPAWFLPLQRAGIFSDPPTPITEAGATRVPKWEVMDYLMEVATIYPDDVTHIIESIPPINSRVIWDCVKIGRRLPTVYTARLVPLVPEWLNAEYFSLTNFGTEIGTWIEHLCKGDQVDSALVLLSILTTPKKKVDVYPEMEGFPERERVEAIPSIDSYGFEQLLERQLSPLLEKAPFEVADTMRLSLREALEMEFPGKERPDFSYLWRPAIEDHPQNWGFQQFKDLVTVALRDVLQKCSETDVTRTRGYLEELFLDGYSIFKRLALHTIRTKKDKFFGLGKKLLLETENYYDTQIYHEFLLLLRELFGGLNETEKDVVLDTLFNHPDKDAADPEARPETQAKQRLYWSVSRLEVIKNELNNEARKAFDQMAGKIGPIEHPTFLSYHESSVGEPSPKTKEELKELSSEEVVQYLRDFRPKPGFREPTPGGLARTFSEDFKTRPDDYLKLAHEFLVKMRPAYVNVFVDTLEEIRNSGKQFDWNLILELFSQFIRMPEPPTSNDLDESGWNYASVRRRIADLMAVWLKHQKPGHLPFEFKDQVWDIVNYLCHDPEPDEKYEEQFGGSNTNPPTLCINTIRGRAMHALMEYALWYAHYTKDKLPKEGDVDRFEPRVKDLLHEKLDKKKDPSEAVHSVFGQFLRNLAYLDGKWLRENTSLIFPLEPRYWNAAWGTYICFSRFSTEFYSSFRDQYVRAISLLPDERIFLDQGGGISPEKGLAEHLMVAYLNDLDSLKEESRVDMFFKRADDHQRAAAIRFIGEIASREKLFAKRDVWEKSLALWETRLEQVSMEKEKQVHQEEFTAFLAWADEYIDPLSRLHKPISLSLSYCKPEWRLDALLKYIGTNAPESGRQAIDLLDQLMRSVGQQGLWWHDDEIRQILASCIESEDPGVQQKAAELINRFGEWGMYKFRDLLPKV